MQKRSHLRPSAHVQIEWSHQWGYLSQLEESFSPVLEVRLTTQPISKMLKQVKWPYFTNISDAVSGPCSWRSTGDSCAVSRQVDTAVLPALGLYHRHHPSFPSLAFSHCRHHLSPQPRGRRRHNYRTQATTTPPKVSTNNNGAVTARLTLLGSYTKFPETIHCKSCLSLSVVQKCQKNILCLIMI